MERAPRFSQWLSCRTHCSCAVRFWIGRLCYSCCRWTPYLARWVPMLPSAVCALSSPHTPVFSASLQWFRSAAIASQCVGLMLPAFRSRLQSTLKRRLGLPSGLVPVVSSLYNMSFMPLTWPSQPSHFWLSKANMLGNPACATTSLLGTQSNQVMPKMLLR